MLVATRRAAVPAKLENLAESYFCNERRRPPPTQILDIRPERRATSLWYLRASARISQARAGDDRATREP
jgi:hypothetical protein